MTEYITRNAYKNHRTSQSVLKYLDSFHQIGTSMQRYPYLPKSNTVGTANKIPEEKKVNKKSKVFFTSQNLMNLVEFHFVLIIPIKLPIK